MFKNIKIYYSNEKFSMDLIHRHRVYELYYLFGGKVNYYISDKIYSVNKGDFVIVPPGMLHRTQMIGEKRERIVLYFSPQMLSVDLDEMLRKLSEQNIIIIPKSKLTILEDILTKIENERNSGHRNSDALLGAYITELVVLLCRYKTMAVQNAESVDKIVVDVAEYISNNFIEKLTLKNLSARFSISESYLSRKFKSIIGTGINNYIQFVRIEHAKELLGNTSMSVTAVSGECGFEDSNYFSVVFKKLVGCSPNNYVKKETITDKE